MATKIEWADETWNPITGCTPISEGCANCYAQRMAKRLAGQFGYPADDPFRVTFHPDRLGQPLRWRKPRMIFVCSMGDLFHEDVPSQAIIDCLSVMAGASQHRFLLLTKRPKRMHEIITRPTVANDVWLQTTRGANAESSPWPLSNVWLGVTAENQEQADKRIPILLQTPAAVRFVSVEPMLEAISVEPYLISCEGCGNAGSTALPIRPGDTMGRLCEDVCIKKGPGKSLDWVICGGETGPVGRPMHPDWARSLRDQCRDAGVPFFFKQWGEWRKANSFGDCYGYKFVDVLGSYFIRVGKKAAGRVLDGVEHNAMPEYHND